MKIEKASIAELKPIEKNVRKHNDVQIKELVRSLEQFGQTRAIVIDEDKNILIGNGLYLAMKQRGDTECDVFVKRGLTERQKKKLILTDNKVYSLGADDYESITDFINEITMDGDFDIAGFDDEVLRQMTRDMDDIAKDIKSYGTIEASDLRKPPQPADTEQARPDVPATPPQVTPAYEQKQQSATVHSERTIICPNCGEVIHLD